jgi:hypothetical protein
VKFVSKSTRLAEFTKYFLALTKQRRVDSEVPVHPSRGVPALFAFTRISADFLKLERRERIGIANF